MPTTDQPTSKQEPENDYRTLHLGGLDSLIAVMEGTSHSDGAMETTGLSVPQAKDLEGKLVELAVTPFNGRFHSEPAHQVELARTIVHIRQSLQFAEENGFEKVMIHTNPAERKRILEAGFDLPG